MSDERGDEPRAFDRFVARTNPAMLVVTVASASERSGCLVGFGAQCSIRPRRFWTGISTKNHTARVAADADVLAVHALFARHLDLARLFGGTTGDETDKFAACDWSPWRDARTPLLDDVPTWFVGRILDRLPTGDHTGYVLEPLETATGREPGAVLRLTDTGGISPGHPA